MLEVGNALCAKTVSFYSRSVNSMNSFRYCDRVILKRYDSICVRGSNSYFSMYIARDFYVTEIIWLSLRLFGNKKPEIISTFCLFLRLFSRPPKPKDHRSGRT